MDSTALTTIADSLADDLTHRPDNDNSPATEPTLAAFFVNARAVDTDRELLAITAALLRLRNTVDHALAAASAAIDRAGLPARKHVRSAIGILTELGAAPAVAYRTARLGGAADDAALSPVTRGMRDGAVSAEHGDAVVRGVGHVTDRVELSDDDKKSIVTALMVQNTPARVNDKARALAIRLAAESQPGVIPVAERVDLNELEIRQGDDGRTAVTVDLDALAAEELQQALEPLCRPIPEPDGSEDKRPAKRRRADAFTELVRTYLSHSQRPESGGVLPHVTLVVPVSTANPASSPDASIPELSIPDVSIPEVSTFGFAGAVSMRTAELVMCDAAVATALVDGEGVPLNLGREKRLFTPGQRKALQLRDQGCAFPGCGAPPSRCDAHHVKHWEHGGATDLDNGVLLCRRHHSLIHLGSWEVFIGHDRHPWFVPPVDPLHPLRRREPICANNRRTLTLLPGAA